MDRQKRSLRRLFRLIIYPSLVVAGLFFYTTGDIEAAMENHFLYFPEKEVYMTPTNVRLPFEEVAFTAADGTDLHGWYVPGSTDRPVVLFFHGNAGNISHRVDNLLGLNRQGHSVFIFDYRGYGQSAGVPSEPGLYNDARGALDWLKKRQGIPRQYVFFGRSLGAAVALQLAIEEPPLALIMESPFTSVAGMGRKHYPLLYRLLGWLVAAKYDNEEKVKHLQVPLLLIHGTRDTIVPPEMGKKLFNLAPQPKQLFLINGADHNDGFYLDETTYWTTWNQFLATLEHSEQR